MSTGKLARKLAPNVIPQHGSGRLLPGGQPGHRGAGGRPPNEFRQWLKTIFESEACRAQVQRVLEDSDHPAFCALYAKLIPYVAGDPRNGEGADSAIAVIVDV